MFAHLKKTRILSVFSTVLVVLNLIELHQCMQSSSYIHPFNDAATDLDEDRIVIKMKNGYCYYGWIKYPRGESIPSFLHRDETNQPTDEFLAFILLSGNVHAKAIIYFNRHVARKTPTDKIIARIHIGDGMYYVAESFKKYDVTRRYHLPGQKFDSPYYPASNCIYIKVPEGGKNVVYRSYLQAIGLPKDTVMIKLTNGLCYYGKILYPGGKNIPTWLHPNQKEPTNEFLAFILSSDNQHMVAHIYRNEDVTPTAPTGRIIARIHMSGNIYFLAQSFEVYHVNNRKRGRSGLKNSSPEYLDRNHVYITVPMGTTSVVYKSPLQPTEIQPPKRFV